MIAIYTRQSVDKKDSISIETQIEFCKREILNEDFKLYDKDKGYSGGNINRPDFQQLMKDVKDGLITKIVVYRLDRISRSILNFTSMMEVFNKHNVEFVSCTEKLDTTTPAGRMVVNILVVFAQYERESTQQRIKDNYYERAKQGVFLGGNTPFGYDSTHTKIANKKTSMLIKNDDQSLIVQNIYDMYVNKNMSLVGISNYFNENNIKIGKDNKGCRSQYISRMIRNPVYVIADSNVYHFLDIKGCFMVNDIEDFNGNNGLISYGDNNLNKFHDLAGYYIAVGLHEGIISSDIWLRAQYKVYNNKQIANNGTSKNTWLSGIAKCGHCGFAMTYKSQTLRKTMPQKAGYLRCSGRANKSCNAEIPYQILEEVESKVFNALVKHIKNGKIKIDEEKNNKNTNSIKLELMSIDKKIDNLVNSLMESDNISMQYINKAISQLHDKKKELANKMMEFENNKTSSAIIDTREFINNWGGLKIEEKKEIVRVYISEIRFYKDNKIEIDFK